MMHTSLIKRTDNIKIISIKDVILGILSQIKVCLFIGMFLMLASWANDAKAGGPKSTWTGASGTPSDWNTSANWNTKDGSTAPPSSSDDVEIPTGLSNYPVITTGQTAYAKKLTIESGATVSQTGGILEYYHDWKNSGTFNATGGTIQFRGSAGNGTDFSLSTENNFYNVIVDAGIDPKFDNKAGSEISIAGDWTDNNNGVHNPKFSYTATFNGEGDQLITSSRGNNNSFSNLSINNSGGTVSLANDINIADNFTMTNGTFDPGTNLLTIGVGFSSFTGGTIKVGASTFAENYSKNLPQPPLAGTTVDYSASGAQTISNSFDYSNLKLSGSGIKTPAGSVTVNDTTILDGITFASGGSSHSLGVLSISSDPTIAFGAGSDVITFADSKSGVWDGSTLTITGWQGTYDGTSGTSGQLFIGTDASGLTAGQLSKTVFYDGSSSYSATMLADGEVVPLALIGAPSNLSYTTPNTFTTENTISPLNPTVTGYVNNYSISPVLPAGLVINAETGIISGTPTSPSGQTVYTVTASNSIGSTTFDISITVELSAPSALSYPTPNIYPQGLNIVPLNPTVTGSVDTYTISPALPTGLTINSSTGIISGIPTVLSVATVYTVTATNTAGSTTFDVSIAVLDIPNNLTYPTPKVFARNSAITPLSPTVSGSVDTYSIIPVLPAGLTINSGTGVISGTPTVNSAPTIYTVTAVNTNGSTTFDISISVVDGKVWTGDTNTDWTLGSNWNGGSVPVSTDEVLIPGDLTNYPIIATSVTVETIKVNSAGSGASLTVETGGDLTLTGGTADYVLVASGGTLVQNGGTILTQNRKPTIAGTYTQTAGTYLSDGDLKVSGVLNQSGGLIHMEDNTVDVPGKNLDVIGGTVIQSGGTIYTKDFKPSSGTFNQNGSGALLKIFKDWKPTSDHTFNSTDGEVQFAGTPGPGVTFTSTNVQFMNVLVDAGVDPKFSADANSLVNIAGNFTNNNTSLTNTDNSTFTFNGIGDQLITGTSTNPTFGHLVINNSGGTVSLANAIETDGDFTMTAGTFDPGSNLLTIGVSFSSFTGGTIKVGAGTFVGNYSKNPSPSAGTIVDYNALGAQIVSNSFSYSNLKLSGSGTKTFNGVTTIVSNLSISNGVTANLGGAASTTSTLTLGGIDQCPGTYGPIGSGATYESSYFAGTGTLQVTAGTLPTASISSNNSPLCSGGDAVFTLSGTSGATVTYKINGGSDASVVLTGGIATVTVSGVIADQTLTLVSVANLNCSQTLSGTSTVAIIPSPTYTQSNDTTICFGDTASISVEISADSAVLFIGSNSIIITDSDPKTVAGEVQKRTVGLWFKSDDVTTRQVLFSDGGGLHGFSIFLEDDSINVHAWETNLSWGKVNTAVDAGIWYHVAFVYDIDASEYFKGYLNGVYFGGNSDPAAALGMSERSNKTKIGKNGVLRFPDGLTTNNNNYSGYIDEFKVWNRALTPDQLLTESYNVFDGPGSDPDLIVYYNFNDDLGTTVTDETGMFDGTVDRDSVTYVNETPFTPTILWSPGGMTDFNVDVSPTDTTTYIFTLTEPTNSCEVTDSIKVSVNPEFTAGDIGNTGESICVGDDPAEIGSSTDASGGDGVITYEWRADGTPIASSNSATYTPPAGLAVTTTYTRYAKDNSCNTTLTKSTGDWVVTVNPLPTASISSNNSPICAEEDAEFTLTGTNDATVTYKINGSSDATVVLSGGTATVTVTAATADQTLTLVSVADVNCSQTLSGTSTVTVNPLPIIGSFN